jgi:Cof subfamily protein (haloacid dehalogenase superfamily)
MHPRLVALDLDGTLVGYDNRLSEGHRRTVRSLADAGIPVVLVTGRPLQTTATIHAALGLDTPLVCFNGTWVGHPAAEPIAFSPLPIDDARAIIEALADQGGVLSAYPDGREWVMDKRTLVNHDFADLYDTTILFDAGRFADWRWPTPKVMFVCEPRRLAAALAVARERLAGRFHVVASQHDRFEVQPLGVTKAAGLERLCAHLGIESGAVWAVGDAPNDIEMLQWVGTACVMGQAGDDLKSLARHVLPPIEEDGLQALPGLMGIAV